MLAFNQVVMKATNGGIAPVFQAGIRSLLAFGVVLGWVKLRGLTVQTDRAIWGAGIALGACFALEFVTLFVALDLTTVSRASILFYSMPVWLGLAAHFWLPGERLTPIRWLGMALAMCGVALALLERGGGTADDTGRFTGNVTGDILALVAAFAWASIALLVRMTSLSRVDPVSQLLWQLGVSAPILLVCAPLFGEYLRDPQPLHWAGLAFQVLIVVSLGYVLWLWVMSRYRASAVASFSFLSPVLAVLFGWLLLGEQIGAQVWLALGLVTVGVVFINRK